MRLDHVRQSRRNSFKVPTPLKGLVNDDDRDQTMFLISGWERAVELAAEMEFMTTPSEFLLRFVSDNLRTTPLSNSPDIVFKIGSVILEGFMRWQWPAMIAPAGSAGTQNRSYPTGWEVFIPSIASTLLKSCLENKSSADQTKAIRQLSPAASHCFSTVSAGWPRPGDLRPEELCKVVDFTALLVRQDKYYKNDYLARQKFGLFALGVSLFKSRSVELSFSLLCLICDILPTPSQARRLAAKEVFTSTKYKAEQARQLCDLLIGAAGHKFHKNCNAILHSLATFGDDFPQPHRIQALLSDGSPIVDTSTEVLETVMWIERDNMVARVFTGKSGEEAIEQCVYRYPNMSLFRLSALNRRERTFVFSYESESSRLHVVQIVVDAESNFAYELKSRCDTLEGCERTFHEEWLRVPKKSKVSRASEPLKAPVADKAKCKTKPVPSVAERQATQTQMIDDDKSSQKQQESSPLSELPSEGEDLTMDEDAVSIPDRTRAKRKSEVVDDDVKEFTAPKRVVAPSPVEQYSMSQVKKRRIVQTETIEPLEREPSMSTQPMDDITFDSPVVEHQSLGGQREAVPTPQPARTSAKAQAEETTIFQKSEVPIKAINIVEHPAETSALPLAATVSTDAAKSPAIPTAPSQHPMSKPSKAPPAGNIKQPRDFTPASTLSNSLNAKHVTQPVGKPSALPAGKPTELKQTKVPPPSIIKQPRDLIPAAILSNRSQVKPDAKVVAKFSAPPTSKLDQSDDDEVIDQEIRRGMLKFAPKEHAPRDNTPPLVKPKATRALRTYKRTPESKAQIVTPEVIKIPPRQVNHKSELSFEKAAPHAPSRPSQAPVFPDQTASEPEASSPLAARISSQKPAVSHAKAAIEPAAQVKMVTKVKAAKSKKEQNRLLQRSEDPKAARLTADSLLVNNKSSNHIKPIDATQTLVTQVTAPVVVKSLAPVQQPVFEALFANLEGVHIAINEHFSSSIHRLKDGAAATRGLLTQEGRDLLIDESERNASVVSTTIQISQQLSGQEQQIIHDFKVVTGIGSETSKIIQAGKQRAWKWPSLKF